LYWRAGGVNYQVVAGDFSDADAEDLAASATMWLRGRMECPPEIEGSKAVQAYLAAIGPPVDRAGGVAWDLDAYETHLAAHDGPGWVRDSLRVLRGLAGRHPSPGDVTPDLAQAWLDDLTRTPTRRKALPSANSVARWRSMARRYYNWRFPGQPEKNPFSGKKVRTPKAPKYREIVYLSRGERRLALRLSRRIAGGAGVWIALYAGLRLKEIAQARGGDLSRGSMTLHVGADRDGATNKTRSTRDVPVHPDLLAYLDRLGARRGRLVPAWRDPRETRCYTDDAENTLDALREAFSARAAKIRKRGGPRAEAHARAVETAAGKLGWNNFRHTVASLLVQNGVSLSKVAAILGNSEEVCRRHYAQFVSTRDRDILRLG
jgi:integrase